MHCLTHLCVPPKAPEVVYAAPRLVLIRRRAVEAVSLGLGFALIEHFDGRAMQQHHTQLHCCSTANATAVTTRLLMGRVTDIVSGMDKVQLRLKSM